MIHFTPEVELHYFRYELLPILLNVSAWTNKTGINALILSIDDGGRAPSAINTTNPGLGLTVDVNVDSGKPEDRENLFQYLSTTMPRDFGVICERDHVHIQWNSHWPERRIRNA